MSGIMRPVGPEPSETYWMRRALVVGAFLVLLIIILLFLFNLGGRPGQAAPAGTPSVAPTGSASSDSSTEASAAPSSASSGSPSDASATAESPSPSASTSPSASSRPSADSTATDKTSPSSKSDEKSDGKSDEKSDGKSDDKKSAESDDTDTAKKSDESKKSDEKQDEGKKQDESKADSQKKDEPAKPRYADCNPKKLRATIKSDKHNVRVSDKVVFELSVINGGETPCTLDLSDKNYELKIFSGTDRIWSSNDCTRIEPKLHRIMQPEQQVEWSITWNGKRSDEDAKCKARPEIPRPGYYYATSAIKGAKPVQFLLVLR